MTRNEQFAAYDAATDKLNAAFERIRFDVAGAGRMANEIVVPPTRWLELANLEFVLLSAKNALIEFARRNAEISAQERDEILENLTTRVVNANMARAGFRAEIRVNREGAPV